MTKLISDERLAELVDMLGIDTDFDEHSFSIKRGTLRGIFARIETLTAERDAATEREMVWRGKFKEAEVDLSFATETGERRATTAIAAWLRGQEALAEPTQRDKWWTLKCISDAIERGNHLTQP